MNQILITEINVNELLDKIGQIIDSRLDKVSSVNKVNHPDLLSRKEVSELLKISLPTLNEWTKLGWLQSYKIGNRVLYKANEVAAALETVSRNKFKKYIK